MKIFTNKGYQRDLDKCREAQEKADWEKNIRREWEDRVYKLEANVEKLQERLADLENKRRSKR